jgi:hypothetical protein
MLLVINDSGVEPLLLVVAKKMEFVETLKLLMVGLLVTLKNNTELPLSEEVLLFAVLAMVEIFARQIKKYQLCVPEVILLLLVSHNF